MAKSDLPSSGVIGVTWHAASKKWRVRIGIGRRHYEIGTFAELDTAIAVRKEAEDELLRIFEAWYLEHFPERVLPKERSYAQEPARRRFSRKRS